MAGPTVVSYSRTFVTAQQDAFDTILAAPLPTVFCRRYGPIPPIRSVEMHDDTGQDDTGQDGTGHDDTGQDGTWGSVGQTRTIRLADGGSMREELTRVERPSAFAYSITGVTGPMKPLVARAEGEWTFSADGAGTRVTWQWTITPRSGLGAMSMPVFRRLWLGYAARSFDVIASLLAEPSR